MGRLFEQNKIPQVSPTGEFTIPTVKVEEPLVSEEEKAEQRRVTVEMAKGELTRLKGELESIKQTEEEKEPPWWKQIFTKEFWIPKEKPVWQMTTTEKEERKERLEEEERERIKEILGQPSLLPPFKDERKETVKNYELAIETYQTFITQAEDPEFFSEVKRGAQETLREPTKLIPFYGAIESLDEMIKTINAAKKLEREIPLTRLEQSLVEKYRAKNLPIPSNIGHGVGMIVTSMPTYIAEWGFLRSLVKVPVTKAVATKVGSSLAGRIVASSIGMAAHGASNVPEIGARTAEYLIPNYEELQNPVFQKLYEDLGGEISFKKALGRAFLTTEVDYITEYAGVLVQKPISFLARATLGKWLARFGLIVPGRLAGLAEKVGWNGIIGEIFEEELAEILQAPIEERKYYSPFTTPEGTERILTETLGIGAFGGIGGISATTLTNISDRRKEEKPPIVEVPKPPTPEPPKFRPSEEAEIFKAIGNFTTADKRTITLEAIERSVGVVEEGVVRGVVLNEEDIATFEEMKNLRDRLKDRAEKVAVRERAIKVPRVKVPAVEEIPGAREAAKDLIRVYVERGDTIEQLADGQMGASTDKYSAQLGGWVGETNIGKWKIAVTELKNEKIEPQIFSLRELYDEIKTGKVAPAVRMPAVEIEVKSLTEPEVKPDETRVSIIDQPLNQAGYIYYLARAKKPIPKALKPIVEDLNAESMQNFGEPQLLPIKGKPGVYKVNWSEEMITKEGIEEFYPMKEYEKVTDWKKLQSGVGIDPELQLGIIPEKGRGVYWTMQDGRKKVGIIIDIFDTGEARLRTTEGIEEMDLYSLKPMPAKPPTDLKRQFTALQTAMGVTPEEVSAKVPVTKREYPKPTNTREMAINDLLPRRVPYVKILKGEYNLAKTPLWWGCGKFLVKEEIPPEVMVAYEEGKLHYGAEFKDVTESIEGLLKDFPKAKPAEITGKGYWETLKTDLIEMTSAGKKYYFNIDVITPILKPFLGANLSINPKSQMLFAEEAVPFGEANIVGMTMPIADITTKDLTNFTPITLPEAPEIAPKPPKAIKEAIPAKKPIIPPKKEVPPTKPPKGYAIVEEFDRRVEQRTEVLRKEKADWTQKQFWAELERIDKAKDKAEGEEFERLNVEYTALNNVRYEQELAAKKPPGVKPIEKISPEEALKRITGIERMNFKDWAATEIKKIQFTDRAYEKLREIVNRDDIATTEIYGTVKGRMTPEGTLSIQDFEILGAEEELIITEIKGFPLGQFSFHTHPSGIAAFSESDIDYVDRFKIPHLVIGRIAKEPITSLRFRGQQLEIRLDLGERVKLLAPEQLMRLPSETPGGIPITYTTVEPRPKRKVRPVPEWWDEIDMIVIGRAIMRPPIDTKTDWRESLGKERYAKVFAGGEFAISPDEMATRLGMTENELREKIVDRFDNPAPKEEIEKTVNRFALEEQKKALKKTAPWIAKAWDHGLVWNELSSAHQEAIKLWVQQKREGLPPEVLEQTEELRYYYVEGKRIRWPTKKVGKKRVEYTPSEIMALARRSKVSYMKYLTDLMREEEREAGVRRELVEELRLPGILKRMRPQVLLDEAEKAKREKESPARDFETLLNVKINPEVAFSKLVEIARDLGVKIKVAEMGWTDGKFSVSRDGTVIRGIKVKDINDYVALTHELGHAIDFVVIGNKAYPKSFSERIGELETAKGERMLKAEVKRASDFVRPFDRQHVKKAYLFYRNRRREMFADWISLYFTDTEKAMTLAPNFTSAMEMRYPKITDLRNKFILPVTHIEPHDLPAKNIKGIYDGFIKSWGKIAPKSEVKVYQDHRNAVSKMGNKMLNLIGLPFWRGLQHPQFNKIYRAVQDHAIYGFNGLKAESLKTLNFKELNELSDLSKAKVVKAIFTGNDKEIQTYFTNEQLKETFRMTDEEIDAYQRIVKVIRQGTDNLIEARKLRYGFYELSSERQKELEPIIRSQVEKLGGYFPLDRFGEIAVFGRVIESETGKETPFFALREDRNEAVKLANLLAEMGYKDVSVYPVKHLPAEFYRNIKRFSFSDLENVAEAAGVDAETPEIKKVKDYLAKAAWDKHLIKRKYVPGYERTYDNLVRTLVSFVESSTSRYSKAKALYEAQKAMKGIDPYKEPETYAFAQNYIKDFFYTNPAEFYELRRGIYFYYLTFKTSFFIQNLTQPLITTLPEIANYVGGVKAPWVFNLAIKDSAKYIQARIRGKTPNLPAQTIEFIDRAFNERVISGMFTEQLLGIVHQKKQKLENVLGSFGIASETANRVLTGMAAIRVARDYLKIEDEGERYAFMTEMVEKTQFPYGAQNIPRFIAGAGTMKGLAKTIAVFKMFMLNYLHFLVQRVAVGTLGAKFWAFSTLFFLSGLFGMPFIYLFNWILRKLTGLDIRTEVRKKLGEGKTALADVVLYGVPTLANLNLSYLIGIGDIISPNRDPTNQIFGAGVGIINRMNWGIELIKQGKTQEGIGYLLPPALGNIVQAQKWAEEGKEFKKDVWTEFSKWEIVQRALSFYPHKLSKQWEVREIETDLFKRYKTLRTRLIEEIKKGKTFREVKDDFAEEIEKHNEKVEEDLFVMYEALGIDMAHKTYQSIEKKYTISKDDLRGWRDEAKEEIKRTE